MILLANSRGGNLCRFHRRSQGDEGGSSCFSEGTFGQPRVQAHDIESDGRKNVLKLGLGQAAIAASAQTESADGLRQRALDPGPFAIPGAPGFRFLPTTNLLQGL